MSYCRWSSDDWMCDLYCYADVSGGYTTHVAGNRITSPIPKVDYELLVKGDPAFMEQHRAQSDALKVAERAPIGLPHDGETFNDPDLPSFLARLEDLRRVGYRFPDYVLDDAREELAAPVPAPEQEEK